MSENNKALALSAEKLGSYISDAWQLENDIYTLEQTEKRFREDARALRASKRKIKPPSLLSSINAAVNETKKEPFKDTFLTYFFAIGWMLVLSLIPAAIVGGVIWTIVNEYCGYESLWPAFVGAAVVPVCFIVRMFAEGHKADKERKLIEIQANEVIIRKNKEIEKENEKMQREYRLALQRAEIDYKAACKKAELMDMQADKTHEQIEKLCNYRKQFLSVGVIPPDYRSYDCIGMFDQIFRNNLADTMREAVAIYEERVFRGDVIRGMGAILTQLDKLRFSMSGLVDSIERAQSRVDDMRSDFKKIIEMQRKQHDLSKDIIKQQGNMIELQENQQELSKNILEESQATKFGVKAIQRCSEYDTFGYFYTT